MSAAIERHQGAVEKFIGDAVMAVFGVPAVREDDALRAVRAAAGLRLALAELNVELARDFGVTLEARTGVNTGEVIAGHRSRRHGFISGDPVNVAARLEQAAAPGEILIGEQTLELVRHAVTVEPLPPLELKGKTQRVPAFRLVDIDVVTPSTGPEFSAPLVGRDHELQQLHAAFDRSVDRRGCELVTIVGPAGIGKSRLAREFAESVHERASVAVGRCLSYGEGLTFWPLREVVTALAGDPDGASSHEVESRLLRLLQDGDETEAVVERVAGALGWSEAAADPPGTFWAVRELLAAARRRAPAGDRAGGHPLGRADLPGPDRASGRDARWRPRPDRRARARGPARGQARLRRRRAAAVAAGAHRRRQQAPRGAIARRRRGGRGPRGARLRARRGQSTVRRRARAHARRRRPARAQRCRSLRRALLAARAAADHPRPARRPHGPPRAGRAHRGGGGRRGRAVLRRRRTPRAHRRRRPRGARRAPRSARAQAADRGGRRAPGGRADLQLQPCADPRRRLPGHAQGASRRPPRAVRGLGRARSRRAGGRARRDDRLPPGARLPLRIRARHARRARARAGCPRRPAARLVGRTCARPRRHPGRRRPARACRPAARRRRPGTARAHDQAQHRAGGDRPAHARRRPPAGARRDGRIPGSGRRRPRSGRQAARGAPPPGAQDRPARGQRPRAGLGRRRLAPPRPHHAHGEGLGARGRRLTQRQLRERRAHHRAERAERRRRPALRRHGDAVPRAGRRGCAIPPRSRATFRGPTTSA